MSNNDKVLTIVRGVSGTGKSTYAHTVSDTVYEADDYFIDPNSGEYRFDASKLKFAHALCRERTRTALATGTTNVVVSNTFTRYWEIEPYIELAEQYGYAVSVVTLTKVWGNIHGVPDEVVNRQAGRFECDAAIREQIKHNVEVLS